MSTLTDKIINHLKSNKTVWINTSKGESINLRVQGNIVSVVPNSTSDWIEIKYSRGETIVYNLEFCESIKFDS